LSHTDPDDERLGLNRPIDRRDFLSGIALGLGAVLMPESASQAGPSHGGFPQDAPGYDPPKRTGMRGSHPGSYERAHALRDGARTFGRTVDTGESFDLVVVGAGIGGLAAAHFFGRKHPGARILILDNHDDFGGHAKRNEFTVDGRQLLANGGSYAIESPLPYSAVARQVLADLGIDPPALARRDDRAGNYRHLVDGRFFDRQTYGVDRLVAGEPDSREGGERPPLDEWRAFAARAPMHERARRDLVRLNVARTNYFPGDDSETKKERLSRMSYAAYLIDHVRVDPQVVAYYQSATHDLYGAGIDAVSALDCWGIGFPGFQGLGLTAKPYHRMGFTAMGMATPNQPPYFFHFPDGNATIARGLLAQLIPQALSARGPAQIVGGRLKYDALDRAGSRVRIRLSSTAVYVANDGAAADATAATVAYVRGDRTYRVKAGSVVMAGWNMAIPYVVPELPATQKEALRYGVKVPLVYTVVAVRSWRAFANAGVRRIVTPGLYHVEMRLDDPVDIGKYESPRSPDQPMLLRLLRTPCSPGLSERDQHRVGRAELLTTPFETFERHIRADLNRVLGHHGFDAARDVAAITVNRWPHGYAYEYNPLWDPDAFFSGGTTPAQTARRRHGRIAIANSDAAAAAYADRAIDEAYRAVDELTA